MSAARELLDRFAEIGATVRPAAGDHLIVRAGANPVPAELVQRLRQAKAEVLAALSPAGSSPVNLDRGGSELAWWHGHFIIRTIERELGGYRSHRDAELLAFGDAILEWHRRHGARPDARRCAGCDDELPGEGGISLCDGARLHLDGVRGVDCIIAYGHRWRSASVAALQTLGVDPPAGFELL
jgi:hypothetical protein